jgi:hypothetical protein
VVEELAQHKGGAAATLRFHQHLECIEPLARLHGIGILRNDAPQSSGVELGQIGEIAHGVLQGDGRFGETVRTMGKAW